MTDVTLPRAFPGTVLTPQAGVKPSASEHFAPPLALPIKPLPLAKGGTAKRHHVVSACNGSTGTAQQKRRLASLKPLVEAAPPALLRTLSHCPPASLPSIARAARQLARRQRAIQRAARHLSALTLQRRIDRLFRGVDSRIAESW